jgi:hypothetical protein
MRRLVAAHAHVTPSCLDEAEDPPSDEESCVSGDVLAVLRSSVPGVLRARSSLTTSGFSTPNRPPDVVVSSQNLLAFG